MEYEQGILLTAINEKLDYLIKELQDAKDKNKKDIKTK